jgi:hypothetical protein
VSLKSHESREYAAVNRPVADETFHLGWAQRGADEELLGLSIEHALRLAHRTAPIRARQTRRKAKPAGETSNMIRQSPMVLSHRPCEPIFGAPGKSACKGQRVLYLYRQWLRVSARIQLETREWQ